MTTLSPNTPKTAATSPAHVQIARATRPAIDAQHGDMDHEVLLRKIRIGSEPGPLACIDAIPQLANRVTEDVHKHAGSTV